MAYVTCPPSHLFCLVHEEILILGTGATLERVDPSVLALLKRKGIAVEVQDTVKYAHCLSALKRQTVRHALTKTLKQQFK